MYKKTISVITLILFFLFLTVSESRASIITVDKNGEIIWKVLSDQDGFENNLPARSYIEVKKVADENVKTGSSVELIKKEDRINLYVIKDNEKREIDITKTQGDIVEIEERPEIQKINIGVKDDNFSLRQRGYLALTKYPLKIDPDSARLSVGTGSGDIFLSVLPYDAVQGVLRTKLISRVNDNKLEIIEENRALQYAFAGEKVFNIFNLFEYTIPVSLKVSATTGETVSIDGPDWYKVIGFFLS